MLIQFHFKIDAFSPMLSFIGSYCIHSPQEDTSKITPRSASLFTTCEYVLQADSGDRMGVGDIVSKV